MRLAVILIALVALVFGPLAGPSRAHGHAMRVSEATAASSGCDHGAHAGATSKGHHCDEGAGNCADPTGCRHLGCAAFGPLSAATAGLAQWITTIQQPTEPDRLVGRGVAPILDPPIRLA